MKLDIKNEKIVVYLYNYFFQTKEKDKLVKEIKNIFLKLIKTYNLNINRRYEVYVYENSKYGTILEIIEKDELLFPRELIDIKVKFINNTNIFLKTDNYFCLENYKNIYYFDNNFYINLLDIDNLISIIEFVDIIYNEKDTYLNKMLLIK